jgi:hypothetical protein
MQTMNTTQQNRLEPWIARLALTSSKKLIRVAYISTEVCDQTGEMWDITTSWFTTAEIQECVKTFACVSTIAAMEWACIEKH